MNDQSIVEAETKISAVEELMALRKGAPLGKGELSISVRTRSIRAFKAGETVASVLGAIGVAANDIWEMRGGHGARPFRSTLRWRRQVFAPATIRDCRAQTADFIRCRCRRASPTCCRSPSLGGRRISATTCRISICRTFERVLSVLDCDDTVGAVERPSPDGRQTTWKKAIAGARACGGKIRTQAEWLAHPQGRFLAGQPLIAVDRVGSSQPEPFKAAERPLSGVRVLDLRGFWQVRWRAAPGGTGRGCPDGDRRTSAADRRPRS